MIEFNISSLPIPSPFPPPLHIQYKLPPPHLYSLLHSILYANRAPPTLPVVQKRLESAKHKEPNVNEHGAKHRTRDCAAVLGVFFGAHDEVGAGLRDVLASCDGGGRGGGRRRTLNSEPMTERITIAKTDMTMLSDDQLPSLFTGVYDRRTTTMRSWRIPRASP